MRINTMRIVCPQCHTAYDVPDHLLSPSARPLRCSACGHSWALTPPEPDPPPPVPLAPAPKLPAQPPAQPKDAASADPRPVRPVRQEEWKANGSAVPVVVLVSVAVLLVLLGVAVLEHRAITRLLPASAPIFKALGLA